MTIIAVDVGFGWTKVYMEGHEPFRFPTWVGYWSGEALSDVKTVSQGGKEYVVGEVVRFVRHKVEIVDFQDLLKWTPVIVRHVLNVLGEPSEPEKIVGGLPPRYYALYKKDAGFRAKIEKVYGKVFPQGFGILIDAEASLDLREGESILVLDVGYNTLDYLLAINLQGRYAKIASNTLENLGVLQAIEIFKNSIPKELLGAIKDWGRSQFVTAFEKGAIKIEGKEVDLKPYKAKALEVYLDLLKSRMGETLTDWLYGADKVVVAGGGANLIKGIRQDAFVPPAPEFSNVRGYLKAASQQS